jgi:hypothetical protein
MLPLSPGAPTPPGVEKLENVRWARKIAKATCPSPKSTCPIYMSVLLIVNFLHPFIKKYVKEKIEGVIWRYNDLNLK